MRAVLAFYKKLRPTGAAHISTIAEYRGTAWIAGIALGFVIGFFVHRAKFRITTIQHTEPVEEIHLLVDFDETNQTGYYWFDKVETRPQDTKDNVLLPGARFDEKVYCIRITNNTDKVLRDVRAFLLFPAQSQQECSFSFGSHSERNMHVGASDYIHITSVQNPGNTAAKFDRDYKCAYELIINCVGFPQLKRRLELDSMKVPALSLID